MCTQLRSAISRGSQTRYRLSVSEERQLRWPSLSSTLAALYSRERTEDQPVYRRGAVPKVPYLFSDTMVEFPLILLMVGEDNRELLRRSLGYSEQPLDELRAAGILIEEAELAELRI